MEVGEMFSVLGIEPVRDAGRIKAAYRKRLCAANPEDDPAGFQRLRTAYERACIYAEDAEEAEGTCQTDRPDDSAAGVWMERAAAVYRDIHRRADPAEWERLFHDTELFSPQEQENCRDRMFSFLAGHFRFPTAVWRLLDERLGIVQDAGRIRERFGTDFVRYLVSKCRYGEEIVFEQFEGEAEASYDLFLEYYAKCLMALRDRKPETAAALLAAADALQIYHPAMEILKGYQLLEAGQREGALAAAGKLMDRYGEDFLVRRHVTEILRRLGKRYDSRN